MVCADNFYLWVNKSSLSSVRLDYQEMWVTHFFLGLPFVLFGGVLTKKTVPGTLLLEQRVNNGGMAMRYCEMAWCLKIAPLPTGHECTSDIEKLKALVMRSQLSQRKTHQRCFFSPCAYFTFHMWNSLFAVCCCFSSPPNFTISAKKNTTSLPFGLTHTHTHTCWLRLETQLKFIHQMLTIKLLLNLEKGSFLDLVALDWETIQKWSRCV